MIKVKFTIDPEVEYAHPEIDLSKFQEVEITFDTEGNPYILFVNNNPVVRNKVILIDVEGKIEETFGKR